MLSLLVQLILGLFFLGICLTVIAMVVQLIFCVIALFLQLPDWIKGVIAIVAFILIVY